MNFYQYIKVLHFPARFPTKYPLIGALGHKGRFRVHIYFFSIKILIQIFKSPNFFKSVCLEFLTYVITSTNLQNLCTYSRQYQCKYDSERYLSNR